ncbi:MBOAT family O-acyltransferase [Anaerocolumna sp.]|uniref:MBOAT family O-acyltransferase n=1 Tax=Anaerocolumna sp. TaxID=2041569 RepID=UPI0028B1235D|nr:MBOAT family O-acyltransferase [Anaerocolumna sp.]
MLFSSITFLYYFLPLVLILYFAVPKNLKNWVLLISSLIFYGWGEPKYILLMGLSIVVQYILGILIERHSDTKKAKFWLVISICFSIGLLGYFKYVDFFIRNVNSVTGLSIPLLSIALPVGISFYTFQILSYTIDVYRKEARAQKNIVHLATYVVLFPQLIAGPIVRYVDIASALENRSHSFEKWRYGLRRFIFGLGKKVLIANSLGEICEIFKKTEQSTVLFYWMYAIAFSLQIYFDFSGYSDMAIGLGKLFGFDFLENFNYPYISRSISEFWRRWHMSLGTWFRDYLYIPMGGNRVKKSRWILNIMVVWMLTGLWHGAAWNFVIWGLLFALLLMNEKLWFEKVMKKLPKFISHIYVLFFVIISFVIFDAANMAEAVERISSMLGMGRIKAMDIQSLYYFRSYGIILILSIIGCTPLPKLCIENIRKMKWADRALVILEPIICIILLLTITAYLVDASFNPFLYFRF